MNRADDHTLRVDSRGLGTEHHLQTANVERQDAGGYRVLDPHRAGLATGAPDGAAATDLE